MQKDEQDKALGNWHGSLPVRVDRTSAASLAKRFVVVGVAGGVIAGIGIYIFANGEISQPGASIIVAIVSGLFSVINALISADKKG